MYTKWSEQEKILLRKIYPSSKREEIKKLLPNRSWASIHYQANQLKIKRMSTGEIRNDKLKLLLEETPQIYYWIGFILADGHIDKNLCLNIFLQKKDAEHLQYLANLLGANMRTIRNSKGFKIGNAVVMKQFINKFDIHNNKTYNPPNLDTLNIRKELLLALFIGLIDGDAHISQIGKNADRITFKVHNSWINYYNKLYKIINQIYQVNVNPPKILKDGYLWWKISHIKVLYGLKQFIKDNNLIVLNRKWDKVKPELYRINLKRDKIIKLQKEGFTYLQIAKQLDISYSYCYAICKKNLKLS